MPYLVKADLYSNMHPETIDTITRDEDDKVTTAINRAIDEAKAFLNRYDLLALFGDDNTEPTVTSEYLKMLVTDLACWHLCRLSNPNVDMALFRTAYEDAKKDLAKAMDGKLDPIWPLRTDTADTSGSVCPGQGSEGINPGFDKGGNIGWNSGRKRRNHW
jgi:hypothetical protein